MNDKKRIKKEIKKLAKEREYEKIYYQYGPKYFRKYVADWYKWGDINELREEGRYIDIYTKYGKLDLETKIKERKERVGKKLHTKNGKIYGWMNTIKVALIRLIPSILASSASLMISKPIATDIEANINKNKYEKQIEEYEKAVEEYAEQFDISEQSDLEIIMKCMYDLHSRIQGYGDPQLDIVGYRGLDVMKDGGIGVCRNFAPNIVDELNAINPEYNARLIAVYAEEGNIISNNIPFKVIEEGIDSETLERGKMITEFLDNEQYVYLNDNLIRKITKNEDETIMEYYENERITKRKIIRKDEKIEILYDNEQNIKEKSIKTENGETRVIYDGERTVKYITEEVVGIKYSKEYIDSKLSYYVEQAEEYYKSVIYDYNGNIISEHISNSDKEESYYYTGLNGEKLYLYTILENGYETRIKYDEDGKEESREINLSDKENKYIRNKELESQLNDEFEEVVQSQEKQQENLRKNRRGNHVIVAVDIESDDITLLIDPTNLALGIYKDGKIIILNDQNPERDSYLKSNIFDDANHIGTKQFLQAPIDYIKSFKEPNISMEEIEAKYGLDAQNKVLEKIEQDESKKTFREEIKIDNNITYNFDDNVVTITNDKAQEDKEIEN
jgi:hypothetical protein